MRRKNHFPAIASFALAVLVLVASQGQGAEFNDKDRQVLRAFSRAIAHVAQKVRPAVVSIYTSKTVKVGRPQFPLPFESPFDDFFKRRDPRDSNPKERKFQRRGLGSGFVIDADKGYILTNNHVIAGAEDIKVRLADEREVEAKLVGGDKKTDLAVIRIKANNLKALKLGDSDRVEVGEFVIAVGSPFGLRETVTAGIVSAKGRSNLAIEDYEDFIQTDAAINMGNSGGPLVNIEGEVVGVNTAILSRTGGSVGVGFAIPVNMAKVIVRQLIKSGKVTRGWLGVAIQDLTPDMALGLGLKDADGVLVGQVIEGTPAAKGGLKPGDVIVEYSGRTVRTVPKLRAYVAATAPDARVKVVVVREGKRKTLTVTIGKLDDDKVASLSPDGTPGASAAELGLSVRDLTAEVKQRLGAKVETGVVVSAVDPTGPAAAKGVKVNDVIIKVGREMVRNTRDFGAALKKADLKKGVVLWIADSEGRRFVFLRGKSKK